ncbi:hypothetical protein NQZ68_028317 [Dissostichus eleginoides]|nr:hypothetical protein NQZ68_028317 [Dissostichus eleginoides]
MLSAAAEEEKLHQVTFYTNHVLCSSAAAAGCWILGHYTAWIRQPAGKGLEWIGMRGGSTTYYKDSLKSKFSIDLDSSSNTVTLNGQSVQPGDSAVYYCARDTL